MIPYKSKVRHVEVDIINFYPIRKNRNYYPSKQKYGDESSMVILFEEHLDETIIAGNTVLSGNIILEIRGLILFFFTLVYTMVMKNIESNQAKQKLSQISPFTTLLKGLILIKYGGY